MPASFSDQILISQYSINHEHAGPVTYSLKMSLPAFLVLTSFLFLSPNWLWITIFATLFVSNDALWKKIKQTWLSASTHVSDAVEKGKEKSHAVDPGQQDYTKTDPIVTVTPPSDALPSLSQQSDQSHNHNHNHNQF